MIVNQKKEIKNILKYFDQTHPHFNKFFTLVNNNTITLNIYNAKYNHITSPVKISETFTSFSYKVIKTSNNDIMYGIGSSELKNNKTDQYTNNDFIGYDG